ncbi:CRISPR-associated protein, Cas2 family [Insolitispirillum peregrinum]|uniref:CRISPR-associated endoribonuclease Cas2 n=2 Tax=Insolitispirillum peregrinum TaxID=80876 RepID=A0A1N7IWW8_9PROT|nr:CRISPR-associated protein, Cas2 family [Insolitispirillum peregrinum]
MRVRETGPWASGYRLLWMLVMFDLPVVEAEERHQATKFRHVLLDHGFAMAQYSVYYRILAGKEAAEAMTKHIAAAAPPKGHIQIVTLTDKQYANIVSLRGREYEPSPENEQLSLF